MLVGASLLGCAGRRSDGAAAQHATYVCADGSRFVVTFPDRSDHAILQTEGTAPRVLAQKRVGSGILYADSTFSLRGKGADAIVSRPGGVDTRCTAAL